MAQIRTLEANEIDCRVAQGMLWQDTAYADILLYKDARVDMRILDEVYGPTNWKRSHELIGDRLYCTISIWDAEKKEWITKQDVGTESNTEPEKGQASDAFKRAGFNVGIGRELYSAPRITVPLNEKEYKKEGSKIKPSIKLFVKEIGYDENREINRLVLVDIKGTERFTFPKRTAKTSTKPATAPAETKPADTRKVFTAKVANEMAAELKKYTAGEFLPEWDKTWAKYRKEYAITPEQEQKIMKLVNA